MSADDCDDDIFDDEDEESDDEEGRDDTGSTGEDNQPQEKKMMEDNQPKPVSTPKTPGRRAPLGMAGFRPVAQNPKPTAKNTAAPIQAVAAESAFDLAKDGIVLTETSFDTFLTRSGSPLKSDDFAGFCPTKVGELVRKWADEALETGCSAVDAWTSAIRKLIELADTKLLSNQLSEEQAMKFKVVAEYFNLELLRLTKPTEAATRKMVAVTEKPKPKTPGPPVLPATKSQTTGTAAPRVTDPHAATEIATPMPNRTSTPASNVDGGHITPEQTAMVAAAAQSIKDEPSVNVQPPINSAKTEDPKPPRFGFVPPDGGSTICMSCGFIVDPTKPCARCKSAHHIRKICEPRVDTASRTSVHPEAGAVMERELRERAPDELPPKRIKAEEPKSRGSLIFLLVVIALGLVTGFIVWQVAGFIVSSFSRTAAPTTSPAPTAVPTVPQTGSETCIKVSPELLRQRYGQSDPSAFIFTKKAGVRIECGGRILYKDPTSGAFDIRPCDICTR